MREGVQLDAPPRLKQELPDANIAVKSSLQHSSNLLAQPKLESQYLSMPQIPDSLLLLHASAAVDHRGLAGVFKGLL
jgi:hypothetical protein